MPHQPGGSQLRVLVDHYHDSGSTVLRRSLAGGPLHVTICREPLTWDLLRGYDVAIIDATAPAVMTDAELDAVERFVAEGGGLLIAGAAPQYEAVTGEHPERMPAARLAARFGVRFLPAEAAEGALHIDRDFRIGYRHEEVVVADGAVEDFGPHPPRSEVWTPLAPPEGARSLLRHGRTGEALATLIDRPGEGRVCVSGAGLDYFNILAHLHPLLHWLAADATPRGGDAPPAETGPAPTLRSVHGLRLICDAPVAERAGELAALIRRFDEFMVGVVGDQWRTPRWIRVLQTSRRPLPWDDGLFLAPTGSEAAVAYNVAVSLAHNALWNAPPLSGLLVHLFPEATVARHLALRFLERLGFDEEAARRRERNARALQQRDPSHTEADLARVYSATEQWHPKGAWLLEELERRFGEDFLSRLFAVLPDKGAEDRLPRSYALPADRTAYYLGLAAGEDLTDLLRSVGTSVHRLPLVPPDDDGFDAAMRAELVDGLTAPADTADAARALDALSDLARLKTDERAELPERMREMVTAFERSVASDVRAVEPLEALARGDDPRHAAWAALQLVTMGREDWAGRLAELLPERDLRFRLMAGHALRKLGRDVPEGSLERMTVGGEAAGELETVAREMVVVHAKVQGSPIANVLAERGLSGFPHGNWASRYYILWVFTSPQWRRSGLSRLAFEVAMAHPEAQRCSCFALNTGTRNNAHALYRDFGFVDMDRREEASRDLSLGVASVPPDNVTIRPFGGDDRDRVRRFVSDYHADAFVLSPLPIPELGDGTFTALAEREGKLVGIAIAAIGRESADGEQAELLELAVIAGEPARTGVGVALLSRLHAMLADAGARRITAGVCSDATEFIDVLSRSGYSRRITGEVNMFGIRDLTQLLTEIRPLFERRLRETPFEDWRGRVFLLGERLTSALEIEAAEVRVLEGATPGALDIVLRTTDERITRIVTGRETPLEGYLQRESAVEPQVSPLVMKLLETLFPTVPLVLRWGW